jgi:hypothetical protein
MNHTHSDKPATSKQLRLLRSLADRSGGTFAYPRTSGEASAEIRKLKGRPRTSAADRRREIRGVREDMSRRRDSSSVKADELGGYGSTAGWSTAVEDEKEEEEKEQREREALV